MTSLAERIAARKAAAAAELQTQAPSPQPAATLPPATSPALAAILAKRQAAMTQSSPVALELPAQIKVAPAPEAVAQPVETVVQVVADIPVEPESEQDLMEQHYADIKARIDSLSALSLEDTVTAMSKLKAALKANPAACTLMLDEDLGLMTIALRRITHSQMVEAEEEKTKGKKPKATKVVALTQEQIAAAWDEL